MTSALSLPVIGKMFKLGRNVVPFCGQITAPRISFVISICAKVINLTREFWGSMQETHLNTLARLGCGPKPQSTDAPVYRLKFLLYNIRIEAGSFIDP